MTALRVWFLWCDEGGYDSADGFVVIAPDETAARALPHAQGKCGDECAIGGPWATTAPLCPWRDPLHSSCELLDDSHPAWKERIVLRSYNAG